jgi:hypothetical protein
MRFCLFFCGIICFFCGGAGCDTAPATPQKPRYMEPSPLVGTWVSEDNDALHRYAVRIWQHADTLMGGYCAAIGPPEDSTAQTDCGTMPDSTPWRLAFAADNQPEPTFESGIRVYHSGRYGRVRITLAGERLYWRMVEAPDGVFLMPKQTTFLKMRSDTSAQ